MSSAFNDINGYIFVRASAFNDINAYVFVFASDDENPLLDQKLKAVSLATGLIMKETNLVAHIVCFLMPKKA